jgi:hypothetical protein
LKALAFKGLGGGAFKDGLREFQGAQGRAREEEGGKEKYEEEEEKGKEEGEGQKEGEGEGEKEGEREREEEEEERGPGRIRMPKGGSPGYLRAPWSSLKLPY